MKALLGKLLGAGAGMFGTFIRVGLAGLAGWLISKGVDAGIANGLTEALIGVVTLFLSALGSFLNNEVK